MMSADEIKNSHGGSADDAFGRALAGVDPFHLRRAIERLREGLFDPVAVRLLTAHETHLNEAIDRAFGRIDEGRAPHLCVVGAYGQGKSHSLTYIQDRALREGFAASMINLDPREIPFHDLALVYRALLAALRLPDAEASLSARWKQWVEAQNGPKAKEGSSIVDLFPDRTPHFFKCVLAAIAQKTVSLPERQKRSKKHAAFRPREFPYILSRALGGEPVPAYRLRSALKYRQVSFYKEASLACRGSEPFLQMIRALASLFRKMGYRGWVILFDEAESIASAQVFTRSRSYKLLDRMFAPEAEAGVEGLFPAFAFTDDFFERVRQEDYTRARVRGEIEIPYFERDYARAWQELSIYRLHDLSRQEWEELSAKLIRLHERAYRWSPPEPKIHRDMVRRLDELRDQETRLKLKALVEQLDLAQQEKMFGG